MGNAISSILGLGSLILTVKAIGSESFGLFILAQTYVIIIDQLASFQSWQAVIKYGSELIIKKNIDEFKSLIKFSMILDCLSIALSLIIALVCLKYVSNFFKWDSITQKIAFFYSLTLLTHFTNSSVGIIRVFNNFKLLSKINIFVSAFKLIAVLILFLLKEKAIYYFLIWILSDAAYFIILFVSAQRILISNGMNKWWRVRIYNYKAVLKFTLWTNLNSTINIPTNFFDVFIISKIISNIEVGIYKTFKQITEIVGKFSSAFDYVIFPQLSFMVAEKDEKKSIKLVIKIGFLIFFIGLPVVLILGLTSKYWLNFFLGSNFSDKWMVFFLFLLVKLIMMIFVGVNPLFISFGYVKFNSFISIISNILFITIAISMGKWIGLPGIIIAFLIQFLFETVFKLLIIFKKGKISKNLIVNKISNFKDEYINY